MAGSLGQKSKAADLRNGANLFDDRMRKNGPLGSVFFK